MTLLYLFLILVVTIKLLQITRFINFNFPFLSMKFESIINYMMIFLIGFLLCFIVNFFIISGYEFPFSFGNMSLDSPSDFISSEDIIVFPDMIVIRVGNATIGRYAATGSMLPVLSERANGIKVKPKSEEEIGVGDIITFRQSGLLIVHRVVDKGNDEKGVYFITKGDNNDVIDGKIRFEDIDYVIIGILY